MQVKLFWKTIIVVELSQMLGERIGVQELATDVGRKGG